MLNFVCFVYFVVLGVIAVADLAKQVIKRFPEKGDMQLVCLRIVVKFQCSRCQATKHAKVLAVVAGDWNRLLCDGCYEKSLTDSGK